MRARNDDVAVVAARRRVWGFELLGAEDEIDGGVEGLAVGPGGRGAGEEGHARGGTGGGSAVERGQSPSVAGFVVGRPMSRRWRGGEGCCAAGRVASKTISVVANAWSEWKGERFICSSESRLHSPSGHSGSRHSLTSPGGEG